MWYTAVGTQICVLRKILLFTVFSGKLSGRIDIFLNKRMNEIELLMAKVSYSVGKVLGLGSYGCLTVVGGSYIQPNPRISWDALE